MSNPTQQHEQQSSRAFSGDEFSALLNKVSPKTDGRVPPLRAR